MFGPPVGGSLFLERHMSTITLELDTGQMQTFQSMIKRKRTPLWKRLIFWRKPQKQSARPEPKPRQCMTYEQALTYSVRLRALRRLQAPVTDGYNLSNVMEGLQKHEQ